MSGRPKAFQVRAVADALSRERSCTNSPALCDHCRRGTPGNCRDAARYALQRLRRAEREAGLMVVRSAELANTAMERMVLVEALKRIAAAGYEGAHEGDPPGEVSDCADIAADALTRTGVKW